MNESGSITFSLKLLRNSIANFIVAGSSLALFLGSIVGFVIIALVEGIGIKTTSTFDLFLIFILGPALVLAVIAYLRLIRDLRQKVTFSPSGITLRVQKSKQILSWDQIRHIEMLPDLFAVQFPTTAVVLRATSPQREQFLSLVREHLPASLQTTLTEAQILQDTRGEQSAGMPMIVVGGIGIGAVMMFWLGWVLGLLPPSLIFFMYLIGFIAWGMIREDAYRKAGTVFTKNGVMVLAFPKQEVGFAIESQWGQGVPWIRWDEVTGFNVRYFHTELGSALGGIYLKMGVKQEESTQWTIQQVLELIVSDPTQWNIVKNPTEYTYQERKRIYKVKYTEILGAKKEEQLLSNTV